MDNSLWQISTLVLPEAEEATLELFGRHFTNPPSAYTDFETGETRVSVYCDKRSGEWTPNKRAALVQGLEFLRQCGLEPGPAKLRVRTVRRENWAESWKRHFKPLDLAGKLLIKPSWSRRRAKAGQTVVVLDPGLSFGTGHHATTSFCLQQLVQQRRRGEPQSFLDLGTGSGILAIAAARLGYQPVLAMDFDPDAVRIAEANARRNRVADRIALQQRDLARLPWQTRRRFDLVCANLNDHLLLEHRDRILNRVRPEGGLVLAGILKPQYPAVKHAYEAAGLREVVTRVEKEWQSAAFGWRA